MNHEERMQQYLDDERVSEVNREKMREFNEFLKAKGRKASTRINYITSLSQLGRWLEDTPFKDVNEKTMVDYINYLKSEREIESFNGLVKTVKANAGVLNTRKLQLRKFYQWLYGMNKRTYPKVVDWFEMEHYEPEVSPEEFLTIDEFDEALRRCKSQQQRAKLCTLRYGGLRIGESLCLNVGDVRLETDGTVILDLTNKTPEQLKTPSSRREVPMVEGSQELLLWLRQHPMSNNKDSPLWIDNKGRRLSYIGWRYQLERRPENLHITCFGPYLRTLCACMHARFGYISQLETSDISRIY